MGSRMGMDGRLEPIQVWLPNWFAKPNQLNQGFRWPMTSSKLINRRRPSTLPGPADPAPATLPRSLLLSWYWRQQVELHQTRCCTHLPRAQEDAWTTRPRRACLPGAA